MNGWYTIGSEYVINEQVTSECFGDQVVLKIGGELFCHLFSITVLLFFYINPLFFCLVKASFPTETLNLKVETATSCETLGVFDILWSVFPNVEVIH
jgi:hypothetical protein